MNTPKERTVAVAAICLGPSGNIQGSYKYFALETCKKITRAQATPVPMTEDIIQWVNKNWDCAENPRSSGIYDECRGHCGSW